MGRALLILSGRDKREQAIDWIKRAPVNTRVTFQGPRRSLDQNSKLWACLTDLSEQLLWHGQKLSPDDWKIVMLASLNQEMRIVPTIDGNGFVPLGRSSSNLSKEEFSDLLELIAAFGAKHSVKFHEERETA